MQAWIDINQYLRSYFFSRSMVTTRANSVNYIPARASWIEAVAGELGAVGLTEGERRIMPQWNLPNLSLFKPYK